MSQVNLETVQDTAVAGHFTATEKSVCFDGKRLGSNPAHCFLNIFSFAGFFQQMDSKVHHLKRLEFCSLLTGKTAPEKNRPFTLCTATQRSI